MFSLTLLIQPGFRELVIEDEALTVKRECVLYLCVFIHLFIFTIMLEVH
jgi:hypothetical protein